MEREFRKTIESLGDIFEAVSDYTRKHQINEETAFQINLAIEETFVNMVKHNPGTGEDIAISLNLENNTLIIRLIDRNVDLFDVTKAGDVDTNQPIHERKPGGLGLHLIKNVMDDVHYEYTNRTCTIKLVKQLET
jgi:serine/threonine-protein kinase RsbW